jgi:alcohol dehydrogenase class IV
LDWQPDRDFLWRDGERVVVFKTGAFPGAPALLSEQGWAEYELLTTERALSDAPPPLAEKARAVHLVPPGRVAEAADNLLDAARGEHLVALGGGRVIDTAKAIAAVRGARTCAIPTTLSGAEMTWIHRLPPGHEDRPRRRPALVLADPEAMTGQQEAALRANAMNSLAHGAEALYTPFANPVATMAALRGAALLAEGLDAGASSPQARRRLALGAILCAYAIDSALFCLHHVLCQSLAQVAGSPHAETNATMLPHTLGAMRERATDAITALAAALGSDLEALPERVRELGGGERRLSELVADEAILEAVADTAAARTELGLTPRPPDRTELMDILRAAW